MRFVLLLIALATLALTAHAEPRSFRLLGGQVVINVAIEGRAVPALLDTAASTSQVSAELAADLGHKTRKGGRNHGASGRVVDYRYTQDVMLDIGSGRTFSTRLGVYPAGARFADDAVEMLIGTDLLRHAAITLDFKRMVIDIRRAGEFTPPPEAGHELQSRGFFPTIRMSIAGTDADIVLDTAASVALHLSEKFARNSRALDGLPKGSARIAGIDGTHAQDTLVVPEAILAGVAFVNVPASVAPLGVLNFGGTDGVAGVELLRRFHITIDFGRKRAWLTPNADVGAPFGAFTRSAAKPSGSP